MHAAIRPLGRIMTAAEAGLYADAAAAAAHAETQAAAMRNQASNEIAAARELVLQAAAAEAQERTARMLAETAVSAKRSLEALAPDITLAVGRAVAKVVGGLDTAQAVAAAARQALDELHARHGIVVHVHPDCAATTRQALQDWGESVRVVGDNTLPSDACTIETPAGIVRAGLREQVAILQAALRQC
jgi:type III secretion protein L